MPGRKVALSGLLAFGAGVAVGANWPRAGNFVGYILQRLGFELTDLALWMWDPEKSVAGSSETSRVTRARVEKRTQARPRKDGISIHQKPRAKARKRARSPRVRTGAGVNGAAGKRATSGSEGRMRNGSSDQSGPIWTAVRLKTSAANASQFEPDMNGFQRTRKKPNGVAARNQRKNAGTRRRGKASSFPRRVLPTDAALN